MTNDGSNPIQIQHFIVLAECCQATLKSELLNPGNNTTLTLDEEELCGQHESVYVYAWGCCPLAPILHVLYTTGRVGWLESENPVRLLQPIGRDWTEPATGLSQLLHNRLVEIISSNGDYLRWWWSLCTLNSNHILPPKLWSLFEHPDRVWVSLV